MFSYETRIRIHDTDPAGIVYFANVPRIAHTAYEEFLEEIGWGLGEVFAELDFVLPIVRLETDYKIPMTVGDRLIVEMELDRIGNSSFTMKFRLLGPDRMVRAEVKTVHCTVSRKTFEKIPLPAEVKAGLAKI